MAAKKKAQKRNNPFTTPSGPWEDRVVFATTGAPFAYRPSQILSTGKPMREQAIRLIQETSDNPTVTETNIYGERYLLESNEPFDVEAITSRLRQLGFRAEPNYVFFNHGVSRHGACYCGACGNPFGGNPFGGNPFGGNPFGGNPFGGNPFGGNPFGGNPFGGNPFGGNPFGGNAETGERPSSARPATQPDIATAKLPASRARARAIILDTGIALKTQLPTMLKLQNHMDAASIDRERADDNQDGFLDPISGHGTFIAGILEQLAPGQDVTVASVLSTYGDGDVASVAKRIDAILASGVVNDRTIFNMSFGSYGDVEMYLVEDAISRLQAAGAVVVSSAGNDATSYPSFPACLPDVVSVGAIEACGRAPYSNFGCWVRACAPGTDIVSSFFRSFNGKVVPEGGVDIDDFKQWAQWSGTSFAAPVVAAALMRHMALTDATAKEAVDVIIDGPSLGRYPGLGTVVNLAPGM